eukprot:s643_g15.t1
MEVPQEPRTLREEDLDWISSHIFLIRSQLTALSERLEAMQQAQNRMQGHIFLIRSQLTALSERLEAMQQAQNRMQGVIRILEARLRRDARNKFTGQTTLYIMLETMDD